MRHFEIITPSSVKKDWEATTKAARPYWIASFIGLTAYIAVFCLAPRDYTVVGMTISSVISIIGLLMGAAKSESSDDLNHDAQEADREQ